MLGWGGCFYLCIGLLLGWRHWERRRRGSGTRLDEGVLYAAGLEEYSLGGWVGGLGWWDVRAVSGSW